MMAGLLVLFMSLTGCSHLGAPLEFAPDGEIIQRAIATQLREHYRQLSQQISSQPPQIKLKHIDVVSIEPLVINSLPTYHLLGHYDLTLTFSSQEETRKDNAFELYLQRQQEGKTWRSLQQTARGWRSFKL